MGTTAQWRTWRAAASRMRRLHGQITGNHIVHFRPFQPAPQRRNGGAPVIFTTVNHHVRGSSPRRGAQLRALGESPGPFSFALPFPWAEIRATRWAFSPMEGAGVWTRAQARASADCRVHRSAGSREAATGAGLVQLREVRLGHQRGLHSGGHPPFTPGRFRHSVATCAIEKGADPALVAAFLNHKSPSTTRRFYATHARISIPTRTPSWSKSSTTSGPS